MSDYKYCWGYEKDDMRNFEDTIGQCLKEAAKIIRKAFERMVFICKEVLSKYKEPETAKEESKG